VQSMPTAEKAQTIEQAREWYSKSKGVVFTDYRGLKVKEMQQLRANIRAKGGELHVLKNTLFRQAAGDDAASLPYELHNGPTAVAFVFENESECAKAIVDYATTNKNLKLKGGFFNGKAFDAKGVEALSKLPPRDVLIAQVIGTIVAPLTNLVGVIEALYADPIRVIGAVADKVAEGSPLPEAAPAAEDQPASSEDVSSTPGEVTATPEEMKVAEEGAVSSHSEASAAPAENEPSVEPSGEPAEGSSGEEPQE